MARAAHIILKKKKKNGLLKCLFLCSCNIIPFLCKLISLLRLLRASLFFSANWWKPRRMHISTNKPFNDAPSEPNRPFVNFSSVQSYCLKRMRQERHINKRLFSHFTHSFAILAGWIDGTTEESRERRRRKKGSCLRGERLLLWLTHHPCSVMTNLLKKNLWKTFLFIFSTGSCITK